MSDTEVASADSRLACECDGIDANNVQAAQECMIDSPTARTLSGIFRALGDPTRLRIISVLAEREICVRDLTAALGMEQPAVSHQLRDMRELGLVRSRREGRHIYYQLDDEHVRDLFRLTLTHVRHTGNGRQV
jgi:ArsR family transcriptional regulator, lead/cadmium/zinc/bismuth-responsive transcriptional repressor